MIAHRASKMQQEAPLSAPTPNIATWDQTMTISYIAQKSGEFWLCPVYCPSTRWWGRTHLKNHMRDSHKLLVCQECSDPIGFNQSGLEAHMLDVHKIHT